MPYRQQPEATPERTPSPTPQPRRDGGANVGSALGRRVPRLQRPHPAATTPACLLISCSYCTHAACFETEPSQGMCLDGHARAVVLPWRLIGSFGALEYWKLLALVLYLRV